MGNVYGIGGGLLKSHELTLRRDPAGLWTGTQIYHCLRSELGLYAPRQREAHPDFDWLHVDSMEVTGMEKGVCRLSVAYAGAFSLGQDDEEVENPPEYALEISVSEEPLETHPRYEQALDPDDIREAVELAKNPPREDDGTLSTVDQTGWSVFKTELYEYLQGGFESYRDPKQTWTKRWISEDYPSGRDEVGSINVPDGNPGGWATGRNWLLVGFRVTERGEVYECEKVWELSGRGGWNADFYEVEA